MGFGYSEGQILGITVIHDAHMGNGDKIGPALDRGAENRGQRRLKRIGLADLLFHGSLLF